VELSANDLSFNLQETKKYLSEVMNLDADIDQVSFLLQTTEGWIAGLQMTALSLKNRPLQQPSLNGILSDRSAILDYFIEEVLSQQDTQTQDFLLKTSILTELSSPLCNAVLGVEDSAVFLNKLESARLFLVPIGGPQAWYRYHPLFAGALAVQLMKKYPELIPVLHARAYSWLLENGYPDRAVSHALAIGDLEKAAEIIDTCAMQAVIDFDVTRLLHWIDSISEEFLNRRPSLGIYSALAYFLLGQLDQMETNVQMAENALNAMQKERISAEKEELLRWEMSAIRATHECLTGNYVQGIPHVKELMTNEKMEGDYVYGAMTHALAVAYEVQGDLVSAAEAYEGGKRGGKKHRFLYGVLHSSVALARLYKLQGRLQDAKREFHEGLDFAVQNHLDTAAISLTQTGLLEIALEQNDTPSADLLAQEVFANLDLVEVSASYSMNHALRCLQLAKYSLYYQDIRRARLFFKDALKAVQDSKLSQKPSPEIMDVYVHIWLALAKDDPGEPRLEEVEGILSPNGSLVMPEQTARARIILAQNHPARALEILNELVNANRGSAYVENYLRALVLQALAFQEAHQLEQALDTLAEALTLGEREKYVRIFVDEGAPMKALLKQYENARKGVHWSTEQAGILHYAGELLAAFEPKTAGSPLPPVQAEPHVTAVFPLQEPLSQRELQILKMLIDGKSIKAIAEELTISINTAKTHVKSVYRKTGTHTRTLLTRRAEELGIQ
jgi:LuxR family transcriptional regulator, maltose regulon positive regulatory protein